MWVVFTSFSVAQAVFESNVSGGSGNWNNSGSWTLISGSDGDDVPDSNDDVTILSGDQINIRNDEDCDDLAIVGTLNYSRSRTLTVNGNLTMSGTSAEITGNNINRVIDVLGSFSIASGADADINGQQVNITGTTTLDGTLNFLSNTGDKTFANIDVNASGTWNNSSTEDFTITGNIINDGTFTGCSDAVGCDYTFTSSSGTFSGSSTITISDMIIDTGASYSSTTDIVITDELTGAGAFTNAAGSTLELQNAGPFDVATFTASASANTVTYTGTGTEPVFETTFHNLVINKSTGTIDNNGEIAVNNDFTVTAGTFEVNSAMTVGGGVLVDGGKLDVGRAFDVSGNLTVSDGELTPDNGNADITVGGDMSLSGGLYDHNNGDMAVTGDLLITGGIMDLDGNGSNLDADNMSIATGTVTLDNGTVNINSLSGGLIVNSGSLDVNGSDVTVANLYDLNGGTNDLDGGSFTVVDLDIETGDVLTVSNTTLVSTGTTTVNGILNFDNGTGSYTLDDLIVASGGTWNVTASADFTINGNIQHNGLAWNACSASACDYTLTSTSGTIGGTSAISLSDVIINGTGNYTNNGTLTVSDRLTGTGAFINGANASFTYSGNNSAGANFNISDFTASATGNTVIYSRAGNMQLRTTTAADNNYHNVVINAVASTVSLAGDITIDNQLTLTAGDAVLGANRLTVEDGATISGGSVDSYIQINSTGVLRQNYSSTGASLSFPIGDNNEYSPITAFTLTAGTFGAGAYVEFDITDVNHPNRDTDNIAGGGDDDGTAATAFISRFWTLTGNAITGERFNATYQYVDADITGIEANMVATLYRGLTSPAIDDWLSAGIVTAGSNTVTLTGGDNFGDLYAMDDTLDRLPIVLISFEAKAAESRVELKWVTGSEENNSFFTVERSTNGSDFEPVLFINGAGDSKTLINYQATDINPKEGLVYYRLKQTDFNGTFSYSELVSVFSAISHIKPDFTIRGNPLNRGARLVISRNQQGEGRLILVGLKAEKLMDIDLEESESQRLEFALPISMGPGTYLLVLQQRGYRVSKKLIVN